MTIHGRNTRRALVAFAVAWGVSWAGYTTLVAAQKDNKAGDKPAATAETKPVLRLPAHYGKVVTPEQRTKIRAIQEQYAPTIQQKRAEVRALVSEQEAAIDKLLTPEQRKEVDKLRAEARAKRQARAGSDSSGTETAAVTEPAASNSGKSKSKGKSSK